MSRFMANLKPQKSRIPSSLWLEFGSRVLGFQQLSCLVDVAMDLRYQFVHTAKSLLRSQAGHEVEPQRLAVEVGVEIEQVGFDSGLGVGLKGGTHTNVGDGVYGLGVHPRAAGVHTVRRVRAFLPYLQVGSGGADRASAVGAFDDDARHLIRPPDARGGQRDGAV